MVSAAGGCELSTTTRVKTAWKKFKELLPVLSSCHLSFKTYGRVYSSCVQSTILHASETWPSTKPNLKCLQRNDRVMIRQICNVKPQDIVTTRSNELLSWLGIENLEVTGIAESGSARLLTLMIDIAGDLVRDLPCLQQASYLEGGPLTWMLPLYLHVNKKSDDDDVNLSQSYDAVSSKEPGQHASIHISPGSIYIYIVTIVLSTSFRKSFFLFFIFVLLDALHRNLQSFVMI